MPATPSTTQPVIRISGVRKVVIGLAVPQSQLQKITEFLQNLNRDGSRDYTFIIITVSGNTAYIDVCVPDHQEGLFYELLWDWAQKQEVAYEGIRAGDIYARDAILNAQRSLQDALKQQERFGYRPK